MIKKVNIIMKLIKCKSILNNENYEIKKEKKIIFSIFYNLFYTDNF